MINVRIKIGDGAIEDTFAAHKLIYIDADNRTEAPIKKRDSTSYAGQAGEHTDPRTLQDAFDYKVIFIIDGQNKDLANVNAIIAAFNKKLYTQTADSDIRVYKEVTLYNDFKRVKIVGLPDPIAEPKEMKRSRNGYDFAEVEFVIRVSDPTKCDFDMPLPLEEYDLSKTDNCWYGLYLNGQRVYKAVDPGGRVKSITSRVSKGDQIWLTTFCTGGNACPYFIVDGLDSRNVLESNATMDENINLIINCQHDGVFIANVMKAGFSAFSVVINRNPGQEQIETLELIEPYDS